jgi:hypothetical protein
VTRTRRDVIETGSARQTIINLYDLFMHELEAAQAGRRNEEKAPGLSGAMRADMSALPHARQSFNPRSFQRAPFYMTPPADGAKTNQIAAISAKSFPSRIATSWRHPRRQPCEPPFLSYSHSSASR